MRKVSYLALTAMIVTGVSTLGVLGQEKIPGPTAQADQKAKELIDKYGALAEKAKIGPDGTKIVDELKSLAGKLSPATQTAVNQLLVSHNLRVIAEATRDINDPLTKNNKNDPNKMFGPLLPFIPLEQPRTKWEYNVLFETDIRTLGKGDVKTGLNALGNDHWELISIVQATNNAPQFYFKRPVAAKMDLPLLPFPDPNDLLPKGKEPEPRKLKKAQ